MELMQLEMFVAVVEEGSVRRAAERVLRTQPAVSIALSKLEREFEWPLFDGSKRRGYRLTEVGEALYHYAKRMLRLRSEAVSIVDDFRNLRLGCLRIGADESISLHVLPTVAKSFLAEHSGIHMEVKCERSENLLVDLKECKLDLAFLSYRTDDREVDCKFLMQDELVLITRASHALAARGRVQVRDLAGESLMVMELSESSPWHRKIADAFVQVKSPSHLVMENAPVEMIKKMVAVGVGVGLVPLMSIQQEDSGELAVVEVDDFHLQRSIWLACRRAEQSQAAKAFVRAAANLGEQFRSRTPAMMSRGRARLPPFSPKTEKANTLWDRNREGQPLKFVKEVNIEKILP